MNMPKFQAIHYKRHLINEGFMKTKIIIGLLCMGILTGCGNDDDSKSDTPLTPAEKIEKMIRKIINTSVSIYFISLTIENLE